MASRYITHIEDLEFFRCDTITITFEFWYDEVTPIDLADMKATIWWTLCPYGQYDYPVIKKKMVISDLEPHVCTVTLTAKETAHLDDIKFSHQPIVQFETREYRRAEGDMILNPHIPYTN